MARGEPVTPRFGVAGSPIAHSRSPLLHRAAYRHLGLDWEFSRELVERGGLVGFLAGLGPRWRGLAVTMPLKDEAAELASEKSPTVAATGAANTLLRRDGDGWAAHNTDVPGLRAALAERGAAPACATAAVLGAGATARSAVVALAGCAGAVQVYARTPARAEGCREAGRRSGVAVEVRPWEELADAWAAPVVVATVPSGALDAAVAGLPSAVHGVLLDIVYEPWPTPLATAWRDRGGAVASGLDLLVHQAAAQLRLMTGADVPVEVLRSAALAAPAVPGPR